MKSEENEIRKRERIEVEVDAKLKSEGEKREREKSRGIRRKDEQRTTGTLQTAHCTLHTPPRTRSLMGIDFQTHTSTHTHTCTQELAMLRQALDDL